MEKLQNIVQKIEILPEKLTQYALNPLHPVGKHKARVFQSTLGYNLNNYHLLIQEILEKALHAKVILKEADNYGIRYQTDFEINGVNGKKAIIRIGWIVESDRKNLARLTTLRLLI
ncbi:hypothetical protein QUF50_06955 [Thiotrichales bacterium HSG1]|nr:hypothetical protein [Thiotrichales bacterium HSG1]